MALLSRGFRQVSDTSLNFIRSLEWKERSTFCFSASLSCSEIKLVNLGLLDVGEVGMMFSETSSSLGLTQLEISLNLEILITTCGSAGMAKELRWETVWGSIWLTYMELVIVGSMISTKSLLRLNMVLSLCLLRISSSMNAALPCAACFLSTGFLQFLRMLTMSGVSSSAKKVLLSPIGVLSDRYLLCNIIEYSFFNFWMMLYRSRLSTSITLILLLLASDMSCSSFTLLLDFFRWGALTTSRDLFYQ